MNVLVVGATGYLGSAICEALTADGHAVAGVVRPSSRRSVPANVRAIPGDVADPASLVHAADGEDAVVYAVAYDGPDQFDAEAAALTALTEALAPGKKTLIYTSGVWLYGNTYPHAVDEEEEPEPPAIVAKRPELERIVRDDVLHGLRAIIIRPGMVYGRGGGLPAMWVQSARNEGAARIVGNGTNHWPMVHVDDLARLYCAALDRAPAGEVLNAAGEACPTVREMAEAASRGAGKGGAVTLWPVEQARTALGPFADALALDQAIDSTRARRVLGWTTRAETAAHDLEAGSYVTG